MFSKAGCLPNDTVEQCSEKLLRSCMWGHAQKLKMAASPFMQRVQQVNDFFPSLLKNLNILKNELDQKYPPLQIPRQAEKELVNA